ncbi:hypothetical protein B0T14DRAFT_523107 [Immersiella caudata]|uniref:Uncharacterized protein n=1 Tax=Immersiella caudata TaxID=314043 RepID=A0AA40BWT2_9PEZI|nr:hypothetical protein B0T14DRAFT_523107 [Immersiella caudata]
MARRIRYYIFSLAGFISAALAGAVFQHFYRADKSTIVTPSALPFVTVLLAGTATTMVAFLATLIITIAHRINDGIRYHRVPHILVFLPWFASWIMMMVSVIKIGLLNKEARCTYLDATTGPWCVGSSDFVVIGAYIVTAAAFFEGWAFWYCMWVAMEGEEKPRTRIMVGDRAVYVDVTDVNAMSKVLQDGEDYYKAKLDADLAELEERHKQDRVAKQQAEEIQKAISAGQTSQVLVGQAPLSDLEAQAAKFRSV